MAFDGFSDFGFPDTVTDGTGWFQQQKALAVEDAFPYISHMKPSIQSGVTRTVRVTAGQSVAHGVWSEMETDQDVVLENQASGRRWDCIAVERVFGADALSTGTRLVVIEGGSSRVIPTLTRNVGGVYQTAIALVEVKSGTGGATLGELVDLRMVREFGNVFTIFDDLAMELVDNIGVEVHNAKTGGVWMRTYNAAGSRSWLPLITRPQFEELEVGGNFGSSQTGWSTGDLGGATSTARRNAAGMVQIDLRLRTGKKITGSSGTGSIADETMFKISETRFRPKAFYPTSFMIYSSTGATYGGHGTVEVNGEITLRSVPPGITLRRERGYASVIVSATYMGR